MKPIVVRRGAAVGKIYLYKGRFEARWRDERELPDGKRQRFKFRPTFASLREAKNYLEQKLTDICNGHTYSYRYTGAQRAGHGRAQDALDDLNKVFNRQDSLEDLVREKRAQLENRPSDRSSPVVAEVVAQFISDKRGRGLSQIHLDNYKTRLGRLGTDFTGQIHLLTGQSLKDWLDQLQALSNRGKPLNRPIGPRTRNNYQSALVELFVFARDEKKYLPADWDGFTAIKRVKIRNRRLIFSPEEMQLLVEAAEDRLLPAIVLGGFAGLRTAEIERLRWEDIDWQNRQIFVAEDIAKNEKERFAPLLDNAASFLESWKEATGPVNTYANLSNQKSKLARKCNLTWKHNALRHSFASYRTAVLQSTDKVKLEMGTSSSDLSGSYLRARWLKVALKYFNISRKTVASGILELKFS